MNIRLIGATAIASLAMAGCATTSPNYGDGYSAAAFEQQQPATTAAP